MRPYIPFFVYLVGAVLLGLFYEQLKAASGGEWLFLFAIVLYASALRFIGAWIARRSGSAEDAGE